MARRSLETYRKKGLDRLERRMVATVSAETLKGKRVLENRWWHRSHPGRASGQWCRPGRNRGAWHRCTSPYARELAREAGVERRTSFRIVDILERPPPAAAHCGLRGCRRCGMTSGARAQPREPVREHRARTPVRSSTISPWSAPLARALPGCDRCHHRFQVPACPSASRLRRLQPSVARVCRGPSSDRSRDCGAPCPA